MRINSVTGDYRIDRLIRGLVSSLTLADSNSWTLHYPNQLGDVRDVAIISTTTTFNETFYVKLERPENALTYMEISFSRQFEGDELSGDVSRVVRCAWYRDNPDLFLNELLPVSAWINFDRDTANIVIQGDPAVDKLPHNNFLSTFIYMGACESYEGAIEDTIGNFFITAGSDIRPEFIERPNFGVNEGNGNIDLIALATRSGVPFQRHDVSINTASPMIIRHSTGESKYTQKFHASDISIIHSTDGYRGKMRNIVVMSRDEINHTNILIENRNTPEERQWMFFDINTPFWFMNNSANPKMSIAVRRV